ncbi:MAG: hypothetical protein IKI41_04015 [Clostridia bacterium]|nr:hypothetical protein [Clostridia bacterium]
MFKNFKKLIRCAALLTLGAACFAACPSCTVPDGHAPSDPTSAAPKPVIVDGLTAADYYKGGKTSNYVTGLDEFGRAFEAVPGEKTDKTRNVGLFYFLTLGQHNAKDIYDVSKLLEQDNGKDILFYSESKQSPVDEPHFWGEPLYGYYNSSDKWVIRRHLELLTEAGVDFLAFDVTNAVTYDVVAKRVITQVCELRNAGWDAPQIVFYTNAYSHRVIKNLYQLYYKNGKYDAAWYRVDGKPLIIGNISMADDRNEARGRGDKSYVSEPFSKEILELFSFRESQWPNAPFREDGFPWIEWEYPAPVHNDVINVAVAAHPALPMSFSITRGADNWGRGWNVNTHKNESDKAAEGQFFQATWDVAIKEDPGTVFVTGWNEWVAGKFDYDGEYALVDLANTEFSRDAEPMKGGHNDAFYIQLAQNIRKYKNGQLPAGAQLDSKPAEIAIGTNDPKWEEAEAVFMAPVIENEARSSKGAAPTVHYEQAAARNFIKEVRIAQDASSIYFRIETEEDVKARENGDSSWMNVFVGTGAVAAGGWEGYGFVIGRTEQDGKLAVEKLSADFSGEKTGEAEYALSGKVLEIKVPRQALSLAADVNSFYFKVADGVENPSDIMDYYVSGKAFPVGRLSFRYLG